MQTIPIESFGSRVNPLLAQQQARGTPLANVKTLAPQQGRLVNMGKSPAYTDAIFNQQIYRDDRTAATEQGNALALEGVRHANQITQLDHSGSHTEKMFGIQKEHTKAMEGLRKSNNLAVQSSAQEYSTEMEQITREFQKSREKITHKWKTDHDEKMYGRTIREEELRYIKRRDAAYNRFELEMKKQGLYDKHKRELDHISNKDAIKFQIGQQRDEYDRQRKGEVADSKGPRDQYEHKWQIIKAWRTGGGKQQYAEAQKEIWLKSNGHTLATVEADETGQLAQAVNRHVATAVNQREAQLHAEEAAMLRNPIPGGFDPNALTPTTSSIPRLTQQLQTHALELEELQAELNGLKAQQQPQP